MARVYVSVGSNIQPEKNVVDAVHVLRDQFDSIEFSPVYRSAAIGFDGDKFLNLVVRLDTSLTLDQIKEKLIALENLFGRKHSHKGFQSRTLDLDLLLYDDVVRHDNQFDLPRGEIDQYEFVLKPLSDIAPDVIHPESGKSFIKMWHEFDSEGILEVRPIKLD